MTAPQDGRQRPLARVLVADDEQLARTIVARILEGMGCRVDTVSNGVEAVEAARTVKYDLIFLDGVMPKMSGLEVARAIRLLPGEMGRVPIVGITGNSMEISPEKCREAGMDEYLQKPVGRDAYRQAVDRWALGQGQPPRWADRSA